MILFPICQSRVLHVTLNFHPLGAAAALEAPTDFSLHLFRLLCNDEDEAS